LKNNPKLIKVKEPVIIIGMHRSGTSLVSKILERSGIFMGADQDNNAESQFFYNLNEWILAQAGATWDNPYNFRFLNEEFKASVSKSLKRQLKGKSLKKYMGAERRGSNSYQKIAFDWGWKDPRNTFTIEIWKDLFEKAKIIHVHRNPVDVAASLRNRAIELKKERQKKMITGLKRRWMENKLTNERIYEQSLRVLRLEDGFLLWKQYIDQAMLVEEKTGCQTYHLCFEDLLRDTEIETVKLFEFLNFKLPDGITRKFQETIVKNKRYSFLKNKELTTFYQSIRNQSLVVEMNYHDIG